MPRSRPSTITLAWMVPAVLASLVVFAAYLLTHPYPATGGGLYLAMADAIRDNGYRLPARVPRYTPNGIPFGYPPLAFYVAALARDVLGVGPLALTRFLPGIVTVLTVVPAYLLGREVFADAPDRNRRAGLAALVVAVSPAVFKWHLSAGGIVRAPAFLFTVTGLYVGLRLFRTPENPVRWAVAGAVLFGLSILTHPSYPVFFGTSYLVFFVVFDRSVAGLKRGAFVAAGGLLLAVPWWGHIASVHGIGLLTRTAGSRLGIGRGIFWFPSKFLYARRTRFLPVWHVLTLVGVVALAVRKRYFLPLWFAATVVMFPKPRFLMLVGAFVVAAAVFDWLPTIAEAASKRDGISTDGGRLPRVSLVLLLLLSTYGVATGGLYAANYGPVPERPLHRLQKEPLPSYIDGDDMTAMRWVRERTAADATVLVAGDAAEWFPVFTHRTVVASPWGAEWLPPEERERQISIYRNASACASATCIRQTLDRDDVSPEYVYLTREGSRSWTARETLNRAQWNEMLERLGTSNGTRVVFRNRDVAVVQVNDREKTNRQSSALAEADFTVPSSFHPRSA
ncbi:ArnT family glycosyltransferase [Haladaptatus paucihalophilus]|nr:hypothetical protein [Haladaptatus paucihalophilus]